MSEKVRMEINEEALEAVSGGVFAWNQKKSLMQYTHQDGSVTTHRVLDFNNAWYWSNQWHSEGISEDVILAKLQSNGFVG